MADPFEPLVIWDLEDGPDGNYAHIVVEHGITQDVTAYEVPPAGKKKREKL